MKRSSIMDRLVAAGGNAVFGGMCGALLASFGSVTSSNARASGALIVALIFFGGYMGRVPGAILGGMSAILIAAFGSLVGGSVLGAVLTVVVSGFISGWISWANSGDTIAMFPLGDSSFDKLQTSVPRLSGPGTGE
jgi:hypothetical protein